MRSLSGLLKNSDPAMLIAAVVFETALKEKTLLKENADTGEVTL